MAGLLIANTLGSSAQVSSGGITGAVTDASGAFIPNATVTATNSQTGQTRTVVTNQAGLYDLPSLQPGSYHLAITASGFGSSAANLQVVLNETAREDAHLLAAGTSTTVDVIAGAAALETESHEVASVIEGRSVENLPSSSRDVFSTLVSLPNVMSYANSNGNSDIDFFHLGGNSLTVGGTTYGNTSYLQDGVTNFNLLTKTANLQPSPEDVAEVSIQENGASARFDEPSVVNVITKSGTNSFHGLVYDYFQNDALNANTYYATTKPELRYNQFGANIGGPIIKDKLQFFFSYNGLRSLTGATVNVFVPTAAERSGDFSADNFIIYNPSTYNPTAGTIQPFAGNKITQIGAFAQQYLQYYPLPNGSLVPGANYTRNTRPTSTYDNYLGRIDYVIGQKDTVFGAYEQANPLQNIPSFTPTTTIFDQQYIQNAKNAYLQETHVFSSSLVNVARIGYNRSKIFETLAGAGKTSYSSQFDVPFITPAALQELPPTVIFDQHYLELGNPYAPDGSTQNTFEYLDEINKTIGRHTLFAGADVNRIQFDGSWVVWNDAEFDFNGQYTGNHGLTTVPASTGSSFADLLLQLPVNAIGARGTTVGYFRQTFVAPYVQDDWKVSSNLKLNIGMRYDFYQAPNDIKGNSNVYDVATNTNHKGTYDNRYLNFAPRLGFAYTLPGESVVRGGYGIYYSPFMYNELQFLLANAPNYLLEYNSYGIANPTPIAQSLVPNPSGSALSPFTVQLQLKTPYAQQWNLALQHSFGRDYSATLTYLGSKTTHLQQRVNPNQAMPGTGTIASRRPYSYVGDVYQVSDVGWGNYNGLQAELSKSYSHGLSFNANYVYSKALDDMTADNQNPRSGLNPAADYGRSDFDRTQVFKLSGVYELTLAPATRSLLVREALGGWQVSGILSVMSGTPFSVLANDASNTGGDVQAYANQICNGSLPHRSFSEWFNTACFVQPAFGTIGNAGRNDLVGPRYTNLDVSVAKNFGFGETRSLQFRLDLFGAPNHPEHAFGTDTSITAGASYGPALVGGGSRRLQVSSKFSF